MNICYVSNSRFPSERAHATQIVQMCNAFVENGHTVTLLVTDRKTDITETPEAFYGVPLKFAVHRISVPDIAGRSRWIPVPLRPFAHLIQRIAFAWGSARFIRAQKFDLVFGRDEWILFFLTFLLSERIIWESHEAKFSYAARKLIQKTGKLIVISEGIHEYYTKHGVPPENILVSHDAIDQRFIDVEADATTVRNDLGIHSKKPVVMYIGGLEEWKGADVLCEAARGQDIFEVYILGGKEGEIEKYKEKYPHVKFLGYRPYRELPLNQQAADILVIPNTAKVSLSSSYTSPLKLFTYMTARRPIVASRVPSIANVLSEDECFFFEPDDPVSLREAVSHVISDTHEAAMRAEKAYQKSLRYTWKNRAKEIVEFIV